MKSILFSPHPVFLSIIKEYFSDPEEYLILGLQDQFVKSLKDIDVQNVQPITSNNDVDNRALDYSVEFIKKDKTLPDKYKDNPIIGKFFEKFDTFAFKRIFDLVAFLLILDDVKPDIVVLHNDVEPYMRLIALWAKENSVPCLHVPHSIIIDSSERTGIGTDIHDLITASSICVAGEYQKQWYLDRGADESMIYMTGLPQFDSIANTLYDPKRALRLLKINAGSPVITYASSWRQDTNLLGCHDGVEETYINFLKACKKVSVRPIVKIHPNSSKSAIDWHVMTAKKVGIKGIISLQHLQVVLQASDAILAYGPSNILLEASFYPVRLITTHGYDQDNAVTKIGNEATSDEIANSISDLMSLPTPVVDGFRGKYIGASLDGKVHERLSSLIMEMLHG